MAEAVAAPVANMVKKDSTMLIVLGVVTVILGVLAMMAPMIAGATVTLMVGSPVNAADASHLRQSAGTLISLQTDFGATS